MRGTTLTEAMITSKTGKQLDEVTKLNMWSYNLRDVSIVEKLPNLEIACFSVNKIRTLEPFSKCPNLKVLFLRGNDIVDFAELKHLQELKHLKSLWLLDNPIAQHKDYREIIVQMLPNLLRLDQAEVTDLERRDETLAIPEPFAPSKTTGHLNETFPDLSVESQIEEPKISPRARPAAARTSPVKTLDKAVLKPQEPAKPQAPAQAKPQPKAQPKPQPKPQEPAKPKPAAKSGVKSSDTAIVNAIVTLLPELSDEGLAAVARAVAEMQNIK